MFHVEHAGRNLPRVSRETHQRSDFEMFHVKPHAAYHIMFHVKHAEARRSASKFASSGRETLCFT